MFAIVIRSSGPAKAAQLPSKMPGAALIPKVGPELRWPPKLAKPSLYHLKHHDMLAGVQAGWTAKEGWRLTVFWVEVDGRCEMQPWR